MNVHISYKLPKTPDLEKLINQQLEKLGRYLQVFRPELVHLKGIVEENSARQGVVVSLNLRLPSGQMASQETSPTPVSAIKAAFDAMVEQVKKHKELLRNQHTWRRKRGERGTGIRTVPFEKTIAAVKPEQVSALDISSYVDVNFPRLKLFIQRELQYREDQDQLLPEQIGVEDVANEAIANALGEQNDKPERIKVGAWVHRLALDAIDRLAAEGGDEGHIPLERSHGQQNVQATDDALLQFHQPDEKLFEENVIADPAATNPEELAARRELVRLVETTLSGAGRSEREAFILYTIEGFTLDEIADITSHTVEEVRTAIHRAREHLQRALPVKDTLKDKLVEYSRSA
ncbi:MAG TPA: HPF/RaiA family ribosome-associated protein [Candidatus Binatia bacterium]|nr:HPF/RaiA family ribosome-associated protein [Candidatus Binatia bacterium]